MKVRKVVYLRHGATAFRPHLFQYFVVADVLNEGKAATEAADFSFP